MSAEFHQNTPGGVEHTGVIDLLTQEPDGTVTMVMVERRGWDGSRQRLFQLQEKFNAYLSFALDGEMTDTYPQLAGKPVKLRLDTLSAPDLETMHMLGLIKEQISFQDIDLEVRVYGKNGACVCGTGACETGDCTNATCGTPAEAGGGCSGGSCCH